MIKTKEMFDATHRRNSQNDWNIESELESSIEGWLLGDEQDCVSNLGEDVTSAVREALNYE